MNKQKTVGYNLIINSIRVFVNLMFPIIVSMYAARILLPEGMGRFAFPNSIISYFIMLSSLGIPLYAIRECAKVRNDKEKLSKTAHELFLINMLSTLASYLLLALCILFVPALNQQREILFIISSSILFTTLGVDWLYQALEQYDYIVIRNFIVKAIALVGLFLLVKKQEDYLYYAAFSVFSSVGSNFFNAINARKLIHFKPYKTYDFQKHIKPILTIFAMNIAISIYANLDTVMLGFMKSKAEVGIFDASVRITRVIIGVVTSLGSVFLPRLSYFVETGDDKSFKNLVTKSINFIFFLSLPAIAILYVFSEEFIVFFSGEAFRAATFTMKILLPIVFFISLSNLIGIQILMPKGLEKITVFSVITGAVVNFTLNLILIPNFSINGAATASLIAEFSVVLFQVIYSWFFIRNALIHTSNVKYIIASISMFVILFAINHTFSPHKIYVFISTFIGGLIYLGVLFLIKDRLLLDIISRIKTLILKKRNGKVNNYV